MSSSQKNVEPLHERSTALQFLVVFVPVSIVLAGLFALYTESLITNGMAIFAGFVFLIALLLFLLVRARRAAAAARRAADEMEERLKRQHSYIRTLGMFGGDALVRMDRDSRITWVSDHASVFFNKTESALLGDLVFDMVPTSRVREFQELLTSALAGTSRYTFVSPITLGDGTVVPAKLCIRSVAPPEQSDKTEFLVRFDDVRENLYLERQIEQLKRRLGTILHSDVVGMGQLLSNGAIREANERFCTMLGYKHGEFSPRSLRALVTPEDAELLERELKEVFREKKTHFRAPLQLRHRNGHTVWVDLAIYAAGKDQRGSVVAYIMAIDENHVKDLEQELDNLTTQLEGALLQTYKLTGIADSANRAKNSFIAVMSHEIRTPLNAIMGMTNVLLDTEMNLQQRDFLETIRISSEDLLTVINDILDYSMLEAGKIEMEPSECRVRQTVEDALDTVASKASAKGLNLAYMIDDDTPDILHTDCGRLKQIVQSLLSNAVKFTNSGDVVVEVQGKQLDGAAADEMPLYQIEVSVRDTGIGISKDHLDRLFESFTQVDSSTTRGQRGIGLGLAICKKLITLLEGTIWVESTEKIGSTFTFTIQTRIPAQLRRPVLKEHPLLSGKSALIVEGNTTNMVLLSKYAKDLGMQITLHGTFDEAATAVRNGGDYDVVLMDVATGSINGIHPVAALRMYNAGSWPSVIIAPYGEELQHADVPHSASITKPIKPLALRDALLEVFGTDTEEMHRQERQAPTLADRAIPLRVLMAEDNMFNRKVALLMLEKMGIHADVAFNGVEAVEKAQEKAYDLILMDIEMPEMDGIEATKRIRALYNKDKQPTIIALTAHAFSVIKEEYNDAEMNDFIAKPVKQETLRQVLERNTGLDLLPVPEPVEEAPPRTNGPPLDESVLNELRGVGPSSSAFLFELFDAFLSETPALVNEVSYAVQVEDPGLLARNAHQLKSNSATLGATSLSGKFFDLERFGRANDIMRARTTLPDAIGEYKVVYEYVKQKRNALGLELARTEG